MSQKQRLFWYLLATILPGSLRFAMLRARLGFDLHRRAHISRFALILPKYLVMADGSRIDAFTVALHLDTMSLESHARIGRSNWITGHVRESERHFTHVRGRDPVLLLGRHAAITKHHIIDCTDRVSIGEFTTIAGYHSQLITHGIDYIACRQHCAPIDVGSHCLVGSRVLILGGASLPDRSVLAAGALLNQAQLIPDALYVGSPAVFKRALSDEAKYMTRSIGFVD